MKNNYISIVSHFLQNNPFVILAIEMLFIFGLAFICSRYFAKKGELLYVFFGFSWWIWLLSLIVSIIWFDIVFDYQNMPLSAYFMASLMYVLSYIANLFGLIWLIHKYKKYKSKKLQNINRRN